MSQFASTLYPQTNPTNPVLLNLRSSMLYALDGYGKARVVQDYIRYLTYAFNTHAEVHRVHALHVLKRLAALSG